MYLVCPSGLMDVFYSAFAKSIYKSGYWTKKDQWMAFKYDWEDTTFIYFERKNGFQKEAKLTMMTPAKTFNFVITEMEKIVNEKTGLIELLTFKVIETFEKATGEFFLSMYETEQKVYDMNHLPRSESLNED